MLLILRIRGTWATLVLLPSPVLSILLVYNLPISPSSLPPLFQGIAYVEFRDLESVPLALGLHGQKLLGVPVIVQPSQAEKNRAASHGEARGGAPVPKEKGPMRLYVGSLHFNITEDMLRGIFEPFGKIAAIQLITDADSGRSKGYGFITVSGGLAQKKDGAVIWGLWWSRVNI